MKEKFDTRFEELLSEGQRLMSSLLGGSQRPDSYVPEYRIAEYQRWLNSALNLIKLIDSSNGTFLKESDRVMEDKYLEVGIPSQVVRKIFGILQSAQDEWHRGFLRKIEHIIIAEAFDDFLDHAIFYHKGNKKIESSVLASAVLEDTVKRIARKNGIESKGKTLEPLIDELIKSSVFTPVKGKRIKGFSGVRNHALHAEWDGFDIRDVGELISGVRELLDTYL